MTGLRKVKAALRAALLAASPKTYTTALGGGWGMAQDGAGLNALVDSALACGVRPVEVVVVVLPADYREASAFSDRKRATLGVRVRYPAGVDADELESVMSEDVATIGRVASDASWYDSGTTGLDSIAPAEAATPERRDSPEGAATHYVVTVPLVVIYRESAA